MVLGRRHRALPGGAWTEKGSSHAKAKKLHDTRRGKKKLYKERELFGMHRTSFDESVYLSRDG